jgi:hypothetical protein
MASVPDLYQVLFHRKYNTIVVDDEVYLTIIAPAAGIVIGATAQAIINYRKKRKSIKTGSNTINPPTSNRRSPILRVLRPITSNLVARKIVSLYGEAAAIPSLNIAVSSSFKVIDGIIYVRSAILAKDIIKYYIKRRENLLKIALNTIAWIVYCPERDRIVSLGFLAITLVTAKLWSISPKSRRFLKIWVCITLLNLSGNIGVRDYLIRQRPANIGVFGLPPVERLVEKSNLFAENGTNSKLSMIRKEEDFVLSSSHQNEVPKDRSINIELENNQTIDTILKDRSKDVELEINQTIQNSTISIDNSVLPKKEGLQKEKTRKSHFTSKRKYRTNNLQNLKKTSDNVTSWNREEDIKTFSNPTKIKAEKVR